VASPLPSADAVLAAHSRANRGPSDSATSATLPERYERIPMASSFASPDCTDATTRNASRR
jgi:hypothetical protein